MQGQVTEMSGNQASTAHPIYVLAGQSNAGSLSVSASYVAAAQGSESYTLFNLLEGGVSLSPNVDKPDWYPFADGNPHSGELYRELVAKIGHAIAETGGYFAGFIWAQGEADTGDDARARNYKANLEGLIAGLRGEFGDSFQTVLVPLSNYPTVIDERPGWHDVRAAQLAVAAGDPKISILDADGYVERLENAQDAYRDHIHYTPEFADILFREAVSSLGATDLMTVAAPRWVVKRGHVLGGRAASDSLHGLATQDTLLGYSGDDFLYGYAGPDILYGGHGNDLLDGGGDKDRMYGGKGDDTYRVNSAGDLVVELPGEGIDSVEASGHFVLPDNVENITALEGVIGLRLTGNSMDNAIAGGSRDDTLSGMGGNDYLRGNDGDDRLLGGAGDDVLVGGEGRNTLSGGMGDDRYLVTSRLDKLKEYSGAGLDTVVTTVDFTLPHFVEIETIIARSNAGSIDLTGNNSNNLLRGNDKANVLRGRDGDDSLRGEGGNDTLDGGPGADRLEGGFGHDVLLDYDTGGAIDLMDGGAGNDTFVLKGNAEVWGGTGSDVFDFRAGFGEILIHDFENGTDRLDFSQYHRNIGRDDLTITQDGEDVRIVIQGFEGGVIILADTQMAELNFDYFGF